MGYGAGPPDPESGCGIQSTREKARLLIGRARWIWNSIGPILAAASKGTSMAGTPCINSFLNSSLSLVTNYGENVW